MERIRVVEADGTPRLLIGNSSVTDAIPMRGVDEKHPGRVGAGLIFVNDEGTECGVLVCAGEDGRQMVRMSFDSYEQNDALMLGHVDEPEGRCSFVELVDRPRWSIVDYLREVADAASAEERQELRDRRFADGAGRRRVRIATEADGAASLVLCDGAGRDRLRFTVPYDGAPAVEVVDPDGSCRTLSP